MDTRISGDEIFDTIKAISPALEGRNELLVFTSLLTLAILMRSQSLSVEEIQRGVLGASQWIVDYVLGLRQDIDGTPLPEGRA